MSVSNVDNVDIAVSLPPLAWSTTLVCSEVIPSHEVTGTTPTRPGGGAIGSHMELPTRPIFQVLTPELVMV